MQLDYKCVNCEETQEARDAQIAHEIVDEGNLQYTRQWMTITEPSNHDWTERDGEFKPPIVQLVDGMTEELSMHLGSLWELEDEQQRAREIECKWCHILTPKVFNDCQSCDRALEHNVH